MKLTAINSLKNFFVYFFLFAISLGCEEEEFKIVPQEYILGKWELVEQGNWPGLEPAQVSGYTEYSEDSVLRFFDYKLNRYTYQSLYWINDSLLVEAARRDDGFLVVTKCKFQFKQNWLRLDTYQTAATFNTFILRKIK
jgi:hypothetical protein